MYRNCQACGNPMFSQNDFGTEPNGILNQDFCSNCYKGGHFYSKDWAGDPAEPLPAPQKQLIAARTNGFSSGFGLSS